jgi:hypothetical protein
MPVDQAFAYMADLRNFEEWDPGVVRSAQVRGESPSSGAAYDVTVENVGRETTLRYEVTDYEPPNRIQVVGKTWWLDVIDVIDVSEDDRGTLVVYDATLVLPFPLSVADKLLDRAFQKIGDRAARGMERALGGTLVS